MLLILQELCYHFWDGGLRGLKEGSSWLSLVCPQMHCYYVELNYDDWTAGIKEGLYDVESLAAYLLYRLNVLNPVCEF
jgi:hypothetical protein